MPLTKREFKRITAVIRKSRSKVAAERWEEWYPPPGWKVNKVQLLGQLSDIAVRFDALWKARMNYVRFGKIGALNITQRENNYLATKKWALAGPVDKLP